jgi:hypothetical protein
VPLCLPAGHICTKTPLLNWSSLTATPARTRSVSYGAWRSGIGTPHTPGTGHRGHRAPGGWWMVVVINGGCAVRRSRPRGRRIIRCRRFSFSREPKRGHQRLPVDVSRKGGNNGHLVRPWNSSGQRRSGTARASMKPRRLSWSFPVSRAQLVSALSKQGAFLVDPLAGDHPRGGQGRSKGPPRPKVAVGRRKKRSLRATSSARTHATQTKART